LKPINRDLLPHFRGLPFGILHQLKNSYYRVPPSYRGEKRDFHQREKIICKEKRINPEVGKRNNFYQVKDFTFDQTFSPSKKCLQNQYLVFQREEGI